MQVAVLGAGSFGSAIAGLLAGKGLGVRLWAREAEVRDSIRLHRENRRFLPGVVLPVGIEPTGSLEEALRGAELVVGAIPSQVAGEVYRSAAPFLPQGAPIVTVSKGIEDGSLLLPTEVIEGVLPEPFHPYLAALSGPSFAREVALGKPTVVTVAASWERIALRVQEAFTTPTFRCYTSSDLIGVQLGGALKNVMAVGCGILEGLGGGYNPRAALITRGLAEMTRIAVARGGDARTLAGLSGLGDLVLTCTGDLSRNRTVGMELGKGRKLQEILEELGHVAEGVQTTRSAWQLAQKLGVEAPITEQVYRILYEGQDPRRAIEELMGREPKAELR